jgi:hypothetical protein
VPSRQRRSRLRYEDIEREEFGFVSVGPETVTRWDLGQQRFLTGTSQDGSAVLFSDNRDRMRDLLDLVRTKGEPLLIPVPSKQIWAESAIAGAPDRGQQAPRRGARSLRPRRAAAATTRQGNERGRGA